MKKGDRQAGPQMRRRYPLSSLITIMVKILFVRIVGIIVKR